MKLSMIGKSRKRVALTFTAQIYNQLITLGVQLMLVPVLLHNWGIEKYGVWLILSAIPTYLVFADFGFTLSAKNDLTLSVARGDHDAALRTYQSTFAMLNGIVAIVLVILAGALWFADISGLFSLGTIPPRTAKQVLFLLSMNLILSQNQQLFTGGLRAIGRPAEEVIWNASARLGEGLVTAVAATQSDEILVAAIAIIATRLLFLFIVLARLSWLASWLKLGFAQVKATEISRLAAPSLAFLAQSFAQIVLIQGPIIVLGNLTTPVEVATFSTCRTLVRLGTTGSNFINASLLPEYTRLYSTNRSAMELALKWHWLITVAMIGIYIAGLAFLGPWILNIWTKGAIHVEQSWLLVMILAAAAEMAWTALFVPLTAINKHIPSSYAYLLVSVASIVALYLAVGNYGLDAVADALLAAHCVMIAVLVIEAKRQLKGHP